MGTSTNCSAFCERRFGERCGIRSREILGTAITCSTIAGASIFCMNSTTRCHICGAGTSRICAYGKMSTMCTAVPLNPQLRPHFSERCRPGGKRVPVVVHTAAHRACRPGGKSLLAHGVVHLALLLCSWRLPSVLGAAWWLFSARSMATLIPCIPQVCTEASLSPPLRGSRASGVVNRRVNH